MFLKAFLKFNIFLGELRYVAISRAIFRIVFIELPSAFRVTTPELDNFCYIFHFSRTLEDHLHGKIPNENTKVFAYHQIIHHKKKLLNEEYLHSFLEELLKRKLDFLSAIIPDVFCGSIDVRPTQLLY